MPVLFHKKSLAQYGKTLTRVDSGLGWGSLDSFRSFANPRWIKDRILQFLRLFAAQNKGKVGAGHPQRVASKRPVMAGTVSCEQIWTSLSLKNGLRTEGAGYMTHVMNALNAYKGPSSIMPVSEITFPEHIDSKHLMRVLAAMEHVGFVYGHWTSDGALKGISLPLLLRNDEQQNRNSSARGGAGERKKKKPSQHDL